MVKNPPLTKDGKSLKEIINYRQKQITCHFYYDCDPDKLTDANRHLVYTVFGKRITNESVNFEIINDQRNRVFGIVDVSILAEYLVISKEEFRKESEVNEVKTKIKKEFG